jgi:hypothetical protein
MSLTLKNLENHLTGLQLVLKERDAARAAAKIRQTELEVGIRAAESDRLHAQELERLDKLNVQRLAKIRQTELEAETRAAESDRLHAQELERLDKLNVQRLAKIRQTELEAETRAAESDRLHTQELERLDKLNVQRLKNEERIRENKRIQNAKTRAQRVVGRFSRELDIFSELSSSIDRDNQTDLSMLVFELESSESALELISKFVGTYESLGYDSKQLSMFLEIKSLKDARDAMPKIDGFLRSSSNWLTPRLRPIDFDGKYLPPWKAASAPVIGIADCGLLVADYSSFNNRFVRSSRYEKCLTLIKTINSTSLCGLTSWRLPTLIESENIFGFAHFLKKYENTKGIWISHADAADRCSAYEPSSGKRMITGKADQFDTVVVTNSSN